MEQIKNLKQIVSELEWGDVYEPAANEFSGNGYYFTYCGIKGCAYQQITEENIFDFMVDCINTVISSIFHKISHKYLFSVAEYLFWYKPSENGANDNILPIHGNMPEIANGLSEAMVQRTESISILSVIWLAGLLLCFGFLRFPI